MFLFEHCIRNETRAALRGTGNEKQWASLVQAVELQLLPVSGNKRRRDTDSTRYQRC